MRVQVILRVYTSSLVLVVGCGRFGAVVAALGKNENSKGSAFFLLPVNGYSLLLHSLYPSARFRTPAKTPEFRVNFVRLLCLATPNGHHAGVSSTKRRDTVLTGPGGMEHSTNRHRESQPVDCLIFMTLSSVRL